MSAIINFFSSMLAYDFMRHAFLAGLLAAMMSGAVGYFIVLRRLAFAGHALGHVGFAGATGAGLLSWPPVLGQLVITLFAAISIGLLGERAEKSDTIIGIILAFFLGLGVFFLYFYKSYAGLAMTILFGDILSVSTSVLYLMTIFTGLSLATLAVIARPLLFTSLEPELAEAKGVSLSLISCLFLTITAIAVTEASQVIGILLVFTLLIGPAASALNWAAGFLSGILLSIGLALIIVVLGIILTYTTDWPSSFWMGTLSLVIYLLSLVRWKKVV